MFALSGVRSEPSRWGLVGEPLTAKPPHAVFGHAMPRIQPRATRLGQLLGCMQTLVRAGHDVKFRDSYAPLRYCRVSQFLAASFARNRRFRDFLKFGTFDGCASGVRVLRVLSKYSLPLTVTQNENIVDPRGPRAVLFRVPVGYWGSP